MSTCTEFAVFEVKKANVVRVLAVSERLFSEINAEQESIIAHEILVKTANSDKHVNQHFTDADSEDVQEICWHLTWANVAAVEASSSKWSSYPSAAAIEALVGKKLYYGHFVAIVGAAAVGDAGLVSE
ncbi:hypothetical protein [Colwellia ponticola]|uniref:Uncharacterized protein n=1 Tax=Colwellia ponticola TaxID=2304625 RepID=A0A8H2JL23_9GAMM|nr:hypothetical protein [Colwellia ponticola]RGP39554.1 hypothetical protein BPTFM16_02802 [Altererythrobacter insulae]TMM44813.1 hypothetical protein FCS21_11130 [Colwellia ponticola]